MTASAIGPDRRPFTHPKIPAHRTPPPPWNENSRVAAAIAHTGAACTPAISIRYRSGTRRARAAPAVPDRRRNSIAGHLPEAAAAESTEAATVKRIDVSELMRTRTSIAKAGMGVRDAYTPVRTPRP